MASPHHRHQSSLEGLINFSSTQTLNVQQRARARSGFYHIIEHFDTAKSKPLSNNSSPYNRPRLIRLTYEYAISEESRDTLLQAFFRSLEIPMDDGEDIDFADKHIEEEVNCKLVGFAEYLLDNFFLPLKASTKKTPQPSPAYHSAVLNVQAGAQTFVGTPARISKLRGSCLIRDRHRCVISRAFDQNQAIERMRDCDDALDDDGQSLAGESFDSLEVAHILPHSLTKAGLDSELDAAREAALTILNMFDKDIAHFIDGTEVDRPRNALTLTHRLHMLFGDFQIFFEPVEGELPHTYRIETFLPPSLFQGLLPTTRTLFLTETRTIEPPSPRLLAVHRAIAHILHLSAAGSYIDRMFRKIEEQETQADGSTDLARLVNLILNGWWDGTVDA
ncbi:HNHc domain-containing protein [Fusarium sp. Ph1]|nr:HNHc domain-containing protein [Fusarium sp. Ph1]